jgi:methylmalonyl-CoA/ethylmalonyl-CoA epimerase
VKILGLNRVELLLPADEIDAAVAKFNDTFGFRLAPPHRVAGQPVLSTVDFAAGIELIAPGGEASPLASRLAEKGRGGIGPLVWEVDDLDAAREHLLRKGCRIYFEFEGEGVRQICLDPDEFFGYVITFMQRVQKD